MNKKLLIFGVASFLLILSLCGCTQDNGESSEDNGESSEDNVGLSISFNQSFVGSRVNLFAQTGHGPYWGPNIVKIASTENKTFTYVMDNSVTPWQIFLYSKTDSGDWQEGESINVGNPPNLMVDSQGYIHLISFDRCLNDFYSTWFGRIFHVKFDRPNTVSGSYSFEYITPDSRETDYGLDDIANLYVGAAIGEDDAMLVVYPNVVDSSPPCSLGARIYDPINDNWSYESVTTDLPYQFCYPFAAITDEYFHVLAIEDHIDEDLPAESPYRFGIVKHFQRTRNSNEWVESTLVDFTAEIDANPEVHGFLWLRNMDLFVDSSGTVHVMTRYNRNWGQGESGNWINTAFHYWKGESATEWQSEQVIDEQCYWLKLWEREDGQLFYVYSHWDKQIDIIPFGTNQHYTISDLNSPYNIDPVPYIANPRSGTNLSSTLDLVIYSGTEEIKAVSISCSISDN